MSNQWRKNLFLDLIFLLLGCMSGNGVMLVLCGFSPAFLFTALLADGSVLIGYILIAKRRGAR